MRFRRIAADLFSPRTALAAVGIGSVSSGLVTRDDLTFFSNLNFAIPAFLPTPTLLCEHAPPTTLPHPDLGRRLAHLPSFTFSEISTHNVPSESVWVTFKEGVYDVTDFVKRHPGGDKILLGAGGSVDRYWQLYGQHLHLPHISHMMEEMRIGNIDQREYEDMQAKKNLDPASLKDDPYWVDKTMIDRHPGLVFITQRPANAEVPPSLLCETFLTPNDIFFVRHHFPVPDPNAEDAGFVTIADVCASGGGATGRTKKMSVQDLESKFKQHEVIATIQCTGNRRSGFNACDPASVPGQVKGLTWTLGAISTAKWSGPLLRDVLLEIFGENGIPPSAKHVCFTGRDNDGNGQHYGVSIQLDRAMDPRSDVILALRMNDEPLPLDHGAPIRVIVPGTAGCRSVKWLKSIELSSIESTAFWQKEDYKGFSPSQGWDGLDFNSAPAVMATPVQSAICDVALSDDKKFAIVKGYSFSGGGLGIIRVDVSVDGGKTWAPADELQNETEDGCVTDLPYRRTYSWTLWKAIVPVAEEVGELEVVAKAVDENYNSQPETAKSIWNVRGILNNSWFRLNCVWMASVLGLGGLMMARPPSIPCMHMQVRFKRSKKRKMAHRVLTEVQKETQGFPSGPSLGSIVGNPQSPYEIAKNIKQHLARLSAMDTTHIRRKKDYGLYNFHRLLRSAGMTHESAPYKTNNGEDAFMTSLTQLQHNADLPTSNLQTRFPFPHTVSYKVYWGPPTVETEPNRYERSMTGVTVAFRVKDLCLKSHEAARLVDIVGASRYDEETGVVSITADIFPDLNHNAAFLGDMLQQLVKLSMQGE